MNIREKCDLFESGWADYHGEHVDWALWNSQNAYRGGWLAAASDHKR